LIHDTYYITERYYSFLNVFGDLV